jgi:alkaline phosphatase
VILVIGDGMGPQQLALLMDWADAAGEGPTEYQRLAERGTLGMLRTGAANSSVTDSAAGATALACGVEVPNGVISVDSDSKPLPTCLEDAQGTGRRTGLVTTTRLTHATPACFAAHVANRSLEKEIARQLVASGVDVMLGGGRLHMGPPLGAEESLGEKAASAGYAVCHSSAELDALKPESRRVLGVFADSHLPYLIDRDGEGEARSPTLAQMTRVALERLGGDGAPFFLMVEAGRIDHGGHLNDVAAVLGELREFDDALAVIEEFRAEHPDTLVVVTADHETGGLAVTYGAAGLPTDEDYLAMARVEQSLEAIAALVEHDEVDPAVFGVGRRGFYPRYSWWETSNALERSAGFKVSYGTQGHTSTPVVVIAAGPGEERFAGLFENEHVGLVLRAFMQEKP